MLSPRAGALALALTLALAGAACSSSKKREAPKPAPPTSLPSAQTAALQKVLDDARNMLDVPGVIAGVWSPAGVWTGISGVSREGGANPPTTTMHTRIGSITKTFTVTIVVQLARDGKLSLDDPIGKYVADVPNAETATLRDLANMTSGIPNYASEEPFQRAYLTKPSTVFTPEQLLFFVMGQPPSFAAGTKFEYSDTNTVLLGMVIEKVTGRSFADVLRDRILAPLRLAQTSFPGASAAVPAPHWSGVTNQGQYEGSTVDATNWNPSWAFTAGGMISTLDDLHTWAAFLGAQPIRTTAASYGMGVRVVDGWVGHAGEMPGFSSVMNYEPASKTTIVVLVNSDVTVKGAYPAPVVFTQLAAAIGHPVSSAASYDAGDQTATEPTT
jgi:D-alanyl-D-alanine carboxypeptidase